MAYNDSWGGQQQKNVFGVILQTGKQKKGEGGKQREKREERTRERKGGTKEKKEKRNG